MTAHRKRTKHRTTTTALLALLLAALLLTLTACSGAQRAETTEVVSSGELSKQKLHDWVNPQEVETLTFRDSLSDAPVGAVDLSTAGDGSVRGWMDGTVLFLAGDGGVTAPANSSYLFSVWQSEKGRNASHRWDKLITVNGAEHLHTENVVSMCSMFEYCENLTAIDVSTWDVSQVQDMSGVFAHCRSLNDLDVSGWNTARTESLNAMFCYCTSLAALDVSGWNTAQVTDVRNLFYYCNSLTEMDVSGWSTGKLKHNSCAFTGTRWEDSPPF